MNSGTVSHDWQVSIFDIYLQKLCLLWVYCSGHAGVKGNDREDTLVGKVNEVLRSSKHFLQAQSQDITPSIAWNREARKEEALRGLPCKTKQNKQKTTKQRSKCWPATLLKKKEAKHKRKKKKNQKENKKTMKEEHDSVADKARNDMTMKEEHDGVADKARNDKTRKEEDDSVADKARNDKKARKKEHDSVADKARNDKKTKKEELTFITLLSLPSLATLALTRADVQVATVVTQLGAAV